MKSQISIASYDASGEETIHRGKTQIRAYDNVSLKTDPENSKAIWKGNIAEKVLQADFITRHGPCVYAADSRFFASTPCMNNTS
jgi:hypothetical protein